MPYEEFNKLFAKNLRYYLNKNNMTQAELAKRLNVGTTSVYNWCNGIKSPRMDKVDAMCDIFNCKRSNLIEDKEHVEENEYYPEPVEKWLEMMGKTKHLLKYPDILGAFQKEVDRRWTRLKAMHESPVL